MTRRVAGRMRVDHERPSSAEFRRKGLDENLVNTPLDEAAAAIARAMGVDGAEAEYRKAFLEFDARDAALLKELHARLQGARTEFVDAFYAHLLAFDEIRPLLQDEAALERLKRLQTAYFASLTAGEYGPEYVRNRLRVGVAHQRIGLSPKWYLGAYGKYLCGVLPEVWRLMDGDGAKTLAAFRALVKIVLFDMGLALDTYIHADQQALRELKGDAETSEQRFRDLVDGLDAIVWEADAVTWRFSFVSRRAEAILGYPVEQWLSEVDFWANHIHPDDRDRTVALCQAATAEGRAHELEYRAVAADGRAVWLRDIVRVVPGAGGRPRQLRGVMVDITRHKHTEEALRQSEERLLQAQKMEAVGRLAGGVAHDFNNFLTVIGGFGERLLRGLHAGDARRRDAEEIRRAAERASDLTRQLLAFSRRQVLAPKVLDLNAVVAGMGAMLRRLIGEDIDLVTVLDPALGHVKADPGQLEQVVMNLAVNARDAMPRGGKLTIETRNVELDEAYAGEHVSVNPGRYVMLAVSDTGCGMDAETRARLFEPFFTTRERGKGTGLGLATVYGIVKQSGGNIWVYSEPGRGTSFKIYLPRVEEAVEAAQAAGAIGGSLRGSETVLLVEDEEGVRTLVREVLVRHGYTVLAARHGGEALLICERHEGPIHLMVTDVVMPEMSGRELAERLAPLHPAMKVLYVSGYTDDAIVHHGVLDRRTPFLEKPFSPDALARKVREVLGSAVGEG